MSIRPRSVCRQSTRRQTRELARRIGDEIRWQRADAGLTQRAVADAAGIDHGYFARVEQARHEPSLAALQSIAAALGSDLSVRLYPNSGPAIHDRFQAAILEALFREIGPGWRKVVEAIVHRPVHGMIDAVLYDPAGHLFVATEVETEVRRLEQDLRWWTSKAEALPSADVWRFAPPDPPPRTSQLLVLRATRANRDLALRFPGILSTAYPARAADALRALRGEADWPGAAIVWADVDGGIGRIRATPPRGVVVGR